MDQTVGLIIGVVAIAITLFLIFWGIKKEQAHTKTAPVAEVEEKAAPVVAEKAAPVKVAPVVPDDLVIIEGIGPKIAALLKSNGIATFAQLADVDVAVLEKLLRENGLQFAKPASWPQQAKLAAEGKMEELKALQEKLTAGR